MHLSPEVKAFLVKVKNTKLKIKNSLQKREKKSRDRLIFISRNQETIPPFSSRNIYYQIKGKKKSWDYYLETKDFEGKQLTPLQLSDAIVNSIEGSLIAFNASDCPITINQGEMLGNVQ